MELYTPSAIRQIRKRYGLNPSKSLGQNFITDKSVIEKIVEGSQAGPDDLVIEIGPGMGVLTAEAARAAGRVVAVEIDKNLIPVLSETLQDYDNIRVINADILKVDIDEIIKEEREAGHFTGGVKILGNLPYYITTPIIMDILEKGVDADSITIMMQKEVADRIKASPGSRIYGGLSVTVQYYCSVDHIADVSREVFIPKPKVDSSVLRLTLRKEKPVELTDEKLFFECLKSGFGQRRKTLLNSLTGYCGFEKSQVGEILAETGIDPGRRAETLNINEFAAIANSAAARCRR